MHEGCSHKGMAVKLLVLGLILILVRTYTLWDMWIVVGAILVIKAVLIYFIPHNCCEAKPEVKKKRK